MYKNFHPLSTLSSFPSLKAFVLSPSILSLAFLQSTSSPILTLHHRWLGTLFYMTFLFVVAVILLNLLIAQFSSTYEDVTEKAKVSVTLNRTKILAGMEKLIWSSVQYPQRNHNTLSLLQNTKIITGGMNDGCIRLTKSVQISFSMPARI